jgi:hypothetical protein
VSAINAENPEDDANDYMINEEVQENYKKGIYLTGVW